MKLTLDMLEAKGACIEDIEYFKEVWGNEADYQEVIDKCVAGDHLDYADWLLDKIGSTGDVLELDKFKGDYLNFAGTVNAVSIEVKYAVNVGKGIPNVANHSAVDVISLSLSKAGFTKP